MRSVASPSAWPPPQRGLLLSVASSSTSHPHPSTTTMQRQRETAKGQGGGSLSPRQRHAQRRRSDGTGFPGLFTPAGHESFALGGAARKRLDPALLERIATLNPGDQLLWSVARDRLLARGAGQRLPDEVAQEALLETGPVRSRRQLASDLGAGRGAAEHHHDEL